ncbi:hypothetical protein CBL_20303, partial [Carabus blaptoides fortunei]
MVSFNDLKIPQLKKELDARGLSVTGQKFETTALTNHWRNEDKVAALVVSLKGSAAEVLQTVPEIERGDYNALMAAIERRYGSEHRKQIFQMELLNRCQRANETLQEYATEIERLAHLANEDASAEIVERVKIQSFINGIRDVDKKRATYSMPKLTFAETVSHAFRQETATLLSRPAHKIHRVEVEQPASLENTMKELIQSLSKVTRVVKLKRTSSNGRDLDPTTNYPTISISQIGRKSNNLTVCEIVNGRSLMLTLDTGATPLILRPDLPGGNVEPLASYKLRTTIGEEAVVLGKLVCT